MVSFCRTRQQNETTERDKAETKLQDQTFVTYTENSPIEAPGAKSKIGGASINQGGSMN